MALPTITTPTSELAPKPANNGGLESATFVAPEPIPTPNTDAGDPITVMLAGIDGATEATKIEPHSKYFKMALVGAQKSGKSWCAATAPGPVYFMDFDNRAQSLVGKPNVIVRTYMDVNPAQPSAIVTLEKHLGMFKYNKKQGKPIPATFVFDTLTYMKKYLEYEVMKQMGASMQRVIKTTATTNVMIPKGWDAVNAVRGYMEMLIGEFSELGNVILVCHEKLEKDYAASTPEAAAYSGKYTIDPQFLGSLLSTFNEVFRITVPSPGKWEVQTGAGYDFNGATTWAVSAKEPPNISAMLAKSKAAKR